MNWKGRLLLSSMVATGCAPTVEGQGTRGDGAFGEGTGGAGTGETGGTSSGGGVTLHGCAAVAQVVCTRLAECAPGLAKYILGDADTCPSRQTALCEAAKGLAGNDVTSEQQDDCAAAMADLSCAELGLAVADSYMSDTLPGACVEATRGTLAAGEPCAADVQCASRRCFFDKFDACGTCAKLGKLGDPCHVEGLVCDAGLYCSGTCKKYLAPGEPCTSSSSCSGAHSCLDGQCRPQVPAGSACGSHDGECSRGEGLFCNPYSEQCELLGGPIVVSDVGGPCGCDDPTKTCGLCVAGSFCLVTKPVPGLDGKCVAFTEEGAMCEASNGPCEAGTACASDGTCTTLTALGCNE